ncbi:MAG TPA: protein kinase [Pyrinomonadaceae bacterium]
MTDEQKAPAPKSPRRDPYRLVGETFDGRYCLEEFAGMGSFGAVYRATATRVGRTVAVKILKPDLGEDETAGARELFQREALTAGRLSHQHIVAVIDVGEHEGFAYMVMEWLDGRTLEQEMRGRAPFTPEEASRLLGQISDALQFAHDAGVIHRDIKPSNIHLGTKDRPFVKMLDFGIAKVITSSTAVAASRIAGTVSYMSPEQITGSVINHRSDIYSLGIVLYQMLTGTLPFVGESQGHIIQQHIAEPPPLLTNARPDLPYALSSVIQRALAKNPEERQHSARELSQEFSAALRPSNQPTQVYTTHDAERRQTQEERGAQAPPTLPPTYVLPEQRDYIPIQQPEQPRDQRFYTPTTIEGVGAQTPYGRTQRANELPPTQVVPPPDWRRQQQPLQQQQWQAPRMSPAPSAGFFRRPGYLRTFVLTSISCFLLLILIGQLHSYRGDLLQPFGVLLTGVGCGLIAMGMRVIIKKRRGSSPAYDGSAAPPGHLQKPVAQSKGMVSMFVFALAGAVIFFLLRKIFPHALRYIPYYYSGYSLEYEYYSHNYYSNFAFPIFGAMTGIFISAFFNSGIWSARPGKRAKAFVAYGALGAAVAMSTYLFYEPDFSLVLAPIGFVSGLIVCGVIVVIQKFKGRSQQ